MLSTMAKVCLAGAKKKTQFAGSVCLLVGAINYSWSRKEDALSLRCRATGRTYSHVTVFAKHLNESRKG